MSAYRFGSRDICDVVFKAKQSGKLGTMAVQAGQPVLYIDTAKTSTLEGAATTVYADGGAGNTHLIAWEGEKTLTFTVEDALLSPISFSILSGAGLISNSSDTVHVHQTSNAMLTYDASGNGTIDLSEALPSGKTIDGTAPIYVMATSTDGSITELLTGFAVDTTTGDKQNKVLKTSAADTDKESTTVAVFVDYYVTYSGDKVSELQIDAENFAGYYYVEATTTFRRQSNGKDLPAVFTLPNVKIQSNFTFSMAATGDPSTFTFTMDAFPGYTYFDSTKKVLCVIQIVEDDESTTSTSKSVMLHGSSETQAELGGETSNNASDSVK